MPQSMGITHGTQVHQGIVEILTLISIIQFPKRAENEQQDVIEIETRRM
jgi:hypothetical protein